jgi:hypothetical protein
MSTSLAGADIHYRQATGVPGLAYQTAELSLMQAGFNSGRKSTKPIGINAETEI